LVAFALAVVFFHHSAEKGKKSERARERERERRRERERKVVSMLLKERLCNYPNRKNNIKNGKWICNKIAPRPFDSLSHLKVASHS
jgi:hypothetical protein